eukprot:5878247-Pyramimonas_sp.AAC.1
MASSLVAAMAAAAFLPASRDGRPCADNTRATRFRPDVVNLCYQLLSGSTRSRTITITCTNARYNARYILVIIRVTYRYVTSELPVVPCPKTPQPDEDVYGVGTRESAARASAIRGGVDVDDSST